MPNDKLQQFELRKTADWEEVGKSFVSLENLRQANESNLAASIAGQKSFYLSGGW